VTVVLRVSSDAMTSPFYIIRNRLENHSIRGTPDDDPQIAYRTERKRMDELILYALHNGYVREDLLLFYPAIKNDCSSSASISDKTSLLMTQFAYCSNIYLRLVLYGNPIGLWDQTKNVSGLKFI